MHIEEGALVGAKIGSISCLPLFDNGETNNAIVVTIIDADITPTLAYQDYKFIQTEELTAIGVAVHPYGAIIASKYALDNFDAEEVVVEFNGEEYSVGLDYLLDESFVGQTLTFAPVEDEGGGGDNGGGGGAD